MPRRDRVKNGTKLVQEVDEKEAKKVSIEKELEIRREKRRKKKRKKKPMSATAKKAYSILVLCIFLIISVILYFCRVENYQMNANSYYTSEEIVEGSGIQIGSSLIFLNTEVVEENLFYMFPYIESFEVEKIYPNTVEYTLIESEEYYSVFYKTAYVVVSKTGKILGVSDTIASGTANIIGGDISDVDGYLSFNDAYTDQIYTDIHLVITTREDNEITEIDISNIDDIRVVYDDRITILLGNYENISYKLRTAFQVLDSGEIKETENGTLDVSLESNSYSATFMPSASTSSTTDDNYDDETTDDYIDGSVDTNGRGEDIPFFG